MILNTFARDDEDTDLLCNTLNAQAGWCLLSDDAHLRQLYYVLIRAQAVIVELCNQNANFTKP